MKKKFIASLLALVLMLSLLSVNAFALTAGNPSSPTVVYVTIANGSVVLAQQPVTVTDTDNDGNLTINDALYAVHEANFEGGAAAGYASENGTYGLMVTKLWGVTNGGGYGYYVNNAAASGLMDPVANGDYLNAFVYTDLASWSDMYSYFDCQEVEAADGTSFDLILTAINFYATPMQEPVAGATITIDNAPTSFVTDAQGKVIITVPHGIHVISATSTTQTLVPPVLTAYIGVPMAGDNSNLVLWIVIGAVALAGLVAVVIFTGKKKHEA